jgi:hypothetical protein
VIVRMICNEAGLEYYQCIMHNVQMEK